MFLPALKPSRLSAAVNRCGWSLLLGILMLIVGVNCPIACAVAAFSGATFDLRVEATGNQDPDDPFAVPDEEEEEEEEESDDSEPQELDDPFAEPDVEDNTDEPKSPGMDEPKEPMKPAEAPKDDEPGPKNSDLPAAGADPQPAPGANPDSMPAKDSESQPMTDTAPALGAESTTPLEAGTDVAFEQFRNLIQQMQANENEINKLVSSMPIGFPDRRKEQQARVDLLRQQNLTMIEDLKPAALKSFDAFPNTQASVTNYLLQQLQFQVTGKNFRKVPFDPVAAREFCQRLAAGGVDVPVFHMLEYRVKYLLNDFEGALASLKLAAAGGQKIDQPVVQNLQTVGGLWQKEQVLRNEDAEKQNPRVEIEMDCGNMVVELYEDQAPNTVANFITLVEDGFYNGLEFYLVSPVEVAVTGSPSNNGQGGPGYTIENEPAGEKQRHHFTGVLSMLPNRQNAVASQFLITKQPLLQYDGRILPFGRVIEGLENLYKITVIDKSSSIPASDDVSATRIIKMTVLRKRDHEYVPEKMMADTTRLPGG